MSAVEPDGERVEVAKVARAPATRGNRPGGRTPRGAASRLRLVNAARGELIEREGAFEVDSVARRAGVSVGLIYRHFGSRAGLIGAVVDDFYTRFRHEALELNPVPGGRVAERERERARLSVAFHYADPLARVVLSNLHLDREVAVQESRHTSEMIDLAAGVMALGQRRGEIPDDRDPQFLAAMVIGGMRHVLAVALDSDPVVDEEVTARQLWTFIAGIIGVDVE